jgi:hypothetical protein
MSIGSSLIPYLCDSLLERVEFHLTSHDPGSLFQGQAAMFSGGSMGGLMTKDCIILEPNGVESCLMIIKYGLSEDNMTMGSLSFENDDLLSFDFFHFMFFYIYDMADEPLFQ